GHVCGHFQPGLSQQRAFHWEAGMGLKQALMPFMLLLELANQPQHRLIGCLIQRGDHQTFQFRHITGPAYRRALLQRSFECIEKGLVGAALGPQLHIQMTTVAPALPLLAEHETQRLTKLRESWHPLKSFLRAGERLPTNSRFLADLQLAVPSWPYNRRSQSRKLMQRADKSPFFHPCSKIEKAPEGHKAAAPHSPGISRCWRRQRSRCRPAVRFGRGRKRCCNGGNPRAFMRLSRPLRAVILDVAFPAYGTNPRL